MSKPKILIVHNYYQIPGGEDTVVKNERKLLEDQGHEVILYSRNNLELKNLSKIQKLCLPFTTIFSLKTYKEVKRIIKEQKIDIVHVHNTLNLISPSVYYAAFACKIPVVQTIHNFRLLCAGATFYKENKDGSGFICEDCLSKGLRCAVKHRCYRGSFLQTLACVVNLKIHRFFGTYKKLNYICLTEFNKEKLLQLNSRGKKIIDPSKVFIKPNFVTAEAECIPYAQRENQFVFAGRLDKLKGIQLLLEAWKNIKDFELIICGIGPEEAWCKRFIEQNNLKNVKMIGFVPNEEVKKIIGKSKALILPTQWYEGYPMTMAESFSLGTPVIGSDIGNVGCLIKENISGLKFRFNSSEDLKEIISKINKGSFNSTIINQQITTHDESYKILNQIYSVCRREGK